MCLIDKYSVRDFDEKTRQDKQKKTCFETMERFLGLRKYKIYYFDILFYIIMENWSLTIITIIFSHAITQLTLRA